VEPAGPVQACSGISLPFLHITKLVDVHEYIEGKQTWIPADTRAGDTPNRNQKPHRRDQLSRCLIAVYPALHFTRSSENFNFFLYLLSIFTNSDLLHVNSAIFLLPPRFQERPPRGYYLGSSQRDCHFLLVPTTC